MPDPLQHALHLILRRLVTELPAQLAATAHVLWEARARAWASRRTTTAVRS
ncbi:hypothetical protein [Streptomyces sp. NPDC046909]|uniref:hypothetical protein n=1 Tax=Streptomyces sp. NPDC046909 TaxID=3155617 RepID=UPI0033C230B1